MYIALVTICNVPGTVGQMDRADTLGGDSLRPEALPDNCVILWALEEHVKAQRSKNKWLLWEWFGPLPKHLSALAWLFVERCLIA